MNNIPYCGGRSCKQLQVSARVRVGLACDVPHDSDPARWVRPQNHTHTIAVLQWRTMEESLSVMVHGSYRRDNMTKISPKHDLILGQNIKFIVFKYGYITFGIK